MADYVLRGVDAPTWKRFKHRAESEGRSLRWVIVELIRRYIAQGLEDTPTSPDGKPIAKPSE